MNAKHAEEALATEPAQLCALVARQASRTPEAVAVVEGDRRATYAQIDARANQFAHYLAGHGVGPESRVGVCLYRSVDLVVALLGIWRAGAAYLPCTPDLPPRRLAQMLADAAADLVVTETQSAGTVRGAGAQPLIMGAICAELDALPVTEPPYVAGPEHAAYVLYTSGSTGSPKGVVVTNSGIANRVAWAVRPDGGLTAADRVLQKTPVTFDAHCWEVFAPLVCGGVLVLAAPGAEADPAAIAADLRTHRITTLQSVPSVLRLLVEEPELAECDALRLVFSAGEPLQTDLVRRLEQRLGRPVEVWNTYGPTECSIDVTAHRVDSGRTEDAVPIGRPLPGFRLLVLGADGRPAAPGAPGELLVGGVGVARGYLGRPGQTAAVFVADPVAGNGSRLYRTGDRVRWNDEGDLEFLGRIDDQVKINGVRIEPAEIEHVLLAHPQVAEAAVAAYVGPDGGKRLAAYLVARPGLDLDLGQLRAHLAQRLSPAQIPSACLPLPRLPLRRNGKLDRFALPAPGSTDYAGRPVRRVPVTSTELLVAEAWREVLKLEWVGLDDDFFQLGGTSLQLTRVVHRLRSASPGSIALRAFFAATTVTAQAELLATRQPAGPRPISRNRPLPLSYAQDRLWRAEQLEPGSARHVTGFVLRHPEPVTVEEVRQTLNMLVERHEALRTRYLLLDGEPTQLVMPAAPVPLHSAEAADPAEAAALLRDLGEADRRRGFDLASGELLRAVTVGAPDGTLLVAVAVHEIAADGWSAAVLEREFGELLLALRETGLPDLPPPSLQYGDFAVWQRERWTEQDLGSEIEDWCDRLAGLRRLAWNGGGSTGTGTGTASSGPQARERGFAPLSLPATQVSTLLGFGRSRGATAFTTLLTAFAVSLAQRTGHWDLPIGTPTAGRDATGVDQTVGCFLDHLMLRCQLDRDGTFETSLDAVRRVVGGAQARPPVPFDRLVERLSELLQPDLDPSRSPLLQVAFDLRDAEFTGLAPGELEPGPRGPLGRRWQAAPADLTLVLRAREDGSLGGGFDYDAAVLDEATAGELTEHLCRVVAQAAIRPAASLRVLEPRSVGHDGGRPIEDSDGSLGEREAA